MRRAPQKLAQPTFTTGLTTLGRVVVVCDGAAVVGCEFVDTADIDARIERWGACETNDGLSQQVVSALAGWLGGKTRLPEFECSVRPHGTPFQQHVWSALSAIPLGTTVTYAAVAATIGRPTSVRAVARAIATNPVAILCPCHRVIGANGALTGYRWGLERKRALLIAEGALIA